MSVLRMFCPLCKSEIDLSPINLSQNQIKCPTCGWSVSAKIEDVECPNCKTKNKILLPEDSQVLEVNLISVVCPKKCNRDEKSLKKQKWGELYYLKCDERAKTCHSSSLITKCKECECILEIVTIAGINSVEILKYNPIVKLYNWFGERIARKIVVDWQRSGCYSLFLSYYYLKKLGEILFCLLLFFVLISFRYLFFSITGYQYYFRIIYDTYFAILLAISVYIGIQAIWQMAVILGEILGELQTTATGLFRVYSTLPFLFLKGRWLLVIYCLINLLYWWDQALLFLSQGISENIKMMFVDDIASLPYFFLEAFIVQVIFTLGAFVFTLWYDSRHGISSFKKGEFFRVSSSINKLWGLCFYIILYLIGTYTTNSLVISLSAHYEPLTKMYFEIGQKEPLLGIFWDYLNIGCCVIIPTVTYFSLLGSLARNLESEELKRIEYERLRANTLEEKNYLIHYMSEVKKSLRVISIIDYVARFILITYLGAFMARFLLLQ